jgi:acetylornithine deacetylase/succinyl-diaminopimelate desuccinylase-like protein
MKKLLPAIFIFLFAFQNISYSQSPVVQSIINQTNLDSLIFFVEELSGEVQTIISGTPYTIVSRNKYQPSNDKAADYIEQKLEYYGLDVYNQSFSSSGRNVYGILTGTEFPNQFWMICAHYDDMPSGSVAPGADDNASGTAAVLEAARILSQESFPYSIIFALWDEEEQGLVGSEYYADQAAANGDSILGVINLDMIAYDSDNDDIAEIHTRSVGNSFNIKDKMVEVKSVYNINLNLQIDIPGTNQSDHKSFWDEGYGAILLIEDWQDFNAYYHTTNDLVIHYNQPYYHKMAKLAIGTLATLALNLDLKIIHTPIASRDNTNDIEASANIVTGFDIGIGQNAPRLYYRIDNGTGWSEFYQVVGVPAEVSGIYNFTIPGQSLGTIVQYYLAVQDENSSIVTTLPVGGGGYSPPGSTPPSSFFQFYVATESIALSDSAMTLDNWTSSGGWDITTSKYNSAPYSFTESPNGNYTSNTTAILTLNSAINLSGYLGAILEFQTQWDIEDNWDYAQALISTNNGSTWLPLEGQYTNPGTGTFQPTGEPLFDGTQLNWVKETMDISDYINQQIKLRFLFRSDQNVVADGWYVDDINLIVFEEGTTNEEQLAAGVFTYSLGQNYPNPFNPSTKIEYKIPEAGLVSLIVYDVLGKEVATLVNEEKAVGNHNVTFNADNLPSGVYFYTIKAEKFINTKKMVLLK